MRIASLVPHATELLFALGLGPQVVAVTHECDYPAQARGVKSVTRDVLPRPDRSGGPSAAEIDAAVRERTLSGEAIYELDRDALAALEPDLIVTQALCSVCAVSFQDVAAFARGLPRPPRVIALDPKTLGETHSDVRTLAEASGRQAQGERLLTEASARIDRVSSAVRSRARPSVLALEWLDPVFVAGHWTPELIELAGGTDAAGVVGEPSRTVSWEALVAARADVVVVMPCGYDATRAHEEAAIYAGQLARLGARRIVAVNASAYFSRPGPRLTDGVELLCHILHPGLLPAPGAARESLPVAIAGAGAP
jgi:iron complex transport system substrate-binding protein